MAVRGRDRRAAGWINYYEIPVHNFSHVAKKKKIKHLASTSAGQEFAVAGLLGGASDLVQGRPADWEGWGGVRVG